MKVKYFAFAISFLLVLGFSGTSLAVLDGAGDTAGAGVADYDIAEAKVTIFSAPSPSDDAIKIALKMQPGSKIPGLVLLQLDVDNDPDTGTVDFSMVSIMDTCEGGTKIKTGVSGIDIIMHIFLRNQGDHASSAFCYNCWGPNGTCTERGAAASCDQSNCYVSGDVCGPLDNDCYVRGATCTDGFGISCKVGDDVASVMTVDCAVDNQCGLGKVRGEWNANSILGTSQRAAERGRIDMPLSKAADDTSGQDEYALPWGRILIAAKAQGADFDLAAAQANPANIKYDLSTFYATDHATNGMEDFFVPITGGTCAATTDVVPDVGMASVDINKACVAACNGDFDVDADVDGTDAVNFKADFFKKNCLP